VRLTLVIAELYCHSGSPPHYSVRVIEGQRDTRELGYVSKCYRHGSLLGRGFLDVIEKAVQLHRGIEIWIFHRQSPMMQAHVSGIVYLGETDFYFAEA
jgi:hypothetical protein